MQHLMLDLETLGVTPGCAVLSVGAVFFDPRSGELGEKFYGVADVGGEGDNPGPYSTQFYNYGLFNEVGTLDWWTKQSQEARFALIDPEANELHIVLQAFGEWLSANGDDVRVWGNGADFDNAIMARACHATRVEMPWKFCNSRCYRTIKNLYNRAPLKRLGTYHNSLDDACSQAEHLMAIVEATELVLM